MEVIIITESPYGGFEAEEFSLAEGTTVEELFHMAVGGDQYELCMLVNKRPVDWDYVLNHGDKVSFKAFRRPHPHTPR